MQLVPMSLTAQSMFTSITVPHWLSCGREGIQARAGALGAPQTHPELPQATPAGGTGTHSGAHVPDHIAGHHGAVLELQLEQRAERESSASRHTGYGLLSAP